MVYHYLYVLFGYHRPCKGKGKDMNENFFEAVLHDFDFSKININEYSPLVLAYIGDAVFEVYVRTLLVHKGNLPVHLLHRSSIQYVKAKAQSDVIHDLMDKLTPEEQDVVRRGRNAKSGTIPKNADVTEYKYATGFEALIGYLYLNREQARLLEILQMAVLEKEKK